MLPLIILTEGYIVARFCSVRLEKLDCNGRGYQIGRKNVSVRIFPLLYHSYLSVVLCFLNSVIDDFHQAVRNCGDIVRSAVCGRSGKAACCHSVLCRYSITAIGHSGFHNIIFSAVLCDGE